jgi:sortase (surface protein transpeptidase)
MWQQIAQRVREIRRMRMRQSRQVAARPIRQQHQRITRLLSAPILLLTVMTFVYLFWLSSTIELQQLIESVGQPQVVTANGVQAEHGAPVLMTATPVPVVMMTATPAPIVPTAVVVAAPTVAQSGRISAIRVPAIGVDSTVVEVGWERVISTTGESELVWQVAKYAVGHHFTSAAPGDMDNIVLSAHVGGYGRVFYRLNELRPNDEIELIRDGRIYRYRVGDSIYLNEANTTESEQIANVSYINPTGSEMVTLVTCWPPSGPDRFSQRLIVRAWPVENANE